MIELSRYKRVQKDNLVSVELAEGGINVKFKRFDVENGKEVAPEVSYVSFVDIRSKLEEMENNIEALRELISYQPK